MIETALLLRTLHDDCAAGMLHFGDHALHTIEPPWRNNEIGKSCIPAGKYRCTMRKSPRYGWKYWLLGTEPRTFILIHGGNLPKHTQGCILPGKRQGRLNGARAVLNSKAAVSMLHEHFEREDFMIEIREA